MAIYGLLTWTGKHCRAWLASICEAPYPLFIQNASGMLINGHSNFLFNFCQSTTFLLKIPFHSDSCKMNVGCEVHVWWLIIIDYRVDSIDPVICSRTKQVIWNNLFGKSTNNLLQVSTEKLFGNQSVDSAVSGHITLTRVSRNGEMKNTCQLNVFSTMKTFHCQPDNSTDSYLSGKFPMNPFNGSSFLKVLSESF